MSPIEQKVKNAVRRASQVFGASKEPDGPDPAAAIDAAIATLRETPASEIQGRGWHFGKLDFYSAFNDYAFLQENRDLWHGRGIPRGIDWDLDGQIETMARLAGYAAELTEVPQEMPDGSPRFHWRNDFWTGLDALVQYAIVRDAKPRRVIETGCGWSSLLLAQALEANEAEGSPRASVDQIDPFPRRELLRALPSHWRLHETILQRAPLSLFEELGEKDICFYDGSHVAKPASDVVWFLSEVLPRVKSGALIHVHDVFWPGEYPDEWIFGRDQTWNEQYVMQAFLMFNSDFRPFVANCMLQVEFPDRIADLFPDFPTETGTSSCWMRRVAD